MKRPAHWDVVVVGSANFDYRARGRALPGPGQTVEADSFEFIAGGKGVNQAVAAARLGARVAFAGRVGKDARGDEIIDMLKAEGVNVDFLARDGREPTGVALVMVGEGGEKQVMAAGGANRRVSEHDVDEARSAIQSAKVVASQLELDGAAVLRTARLSKEAGALFLLDPAAARALPDDLLALCDLIKPDAEQARVLTGIRCDNEASAAEAARQLVLRGARAACVPGGRQGDFLVWPGGHHWLARLPLAAVGSAGAGDAFLGAMAAALAEGQRWDEAGRFGSVAAALKTTAPGALAGMPRRAAVLRLLAERRAVSGAR